MCLLEIAQAKFYSYKGVPIQFGIQPEYVSSSAVKTTAVSSDFCGNKRFSGAR